MSSNEKHACRLCYYDTVDTVNIFSEKGISFDYIGKIKRYLYLSVSLDDDLPKTVCWMCTQHLDTFHRFFEKINEIQRNTLTTKYDEYSILRHSEREPPTVNKESAVASINRKEPAIDSGYVYEILLLSDDGDTKADDINEIDEYELLEVTHADENNPNEITRQHQLESEESSSNQTTSKQAIRHSARISANANRTRKKSPDGIGTKTVKNSDEVIVDQLQTEEYSIAADRWPEQGTLDDFPKDLIKNGLIQFKGDKMMTLISRFYNLDCRACSTKQRFGHVNELFDHYKEYHQEDGYVECCQTKLTRYPAIMMHMARHLQPDAFKCNECGYIVARPTFLQAHKTTHLPDNEKPYGCKECGRRFCWKNAYRIHMIRHRPAEERPQYICKICNRKYDTGSGLSTHKKLAHSGQQRVVDSHICHICAKSFATRTSLQEHMATIHQEREKNQVRCTECGKWLMNKRCLRAHMILHSDSVLHCDLCDYMTKKKPLLKRHLLTKHSTDKPFVCNVCGRAFKLKRGLTIHLAQHTATSSFTCEFCGREFNSSTNYYSHRKHSHPIELAELKQREEAERRQKRIEAGIEQG